MTTWSLADEMYKKRREAEEKAEREQDGMPCSPPVRSDFMPMRSHHMLGVLALLAGGLAPVRGERKSEKPFDSSAPKPIEHQPAAKRNDPCPCGSKKKFKKCCGTK